jgi:hypothetical protein
MHRDTHRRSAKNQVFACSIVLVVLGSTNVAHAQTAGDVLDKMPAEQQASYVAGVIEGLAYARFLRDKPDETGMQCIYDWYYGSGAEKWGEIEQWFRRHADKPVGPLVHVLTERECGT